MKEINPRWEYDCGHCKFHWCCGPTCACSSWRRKPNPERRWYVIWLAGHPGVHFPKKMRKLPRGLCAEVKPGKVKIGQRIRFHVPGKPWREGVVTGYRKYGAIAVRTT
jgi:hypothetical protein